MIPTNPHVWTFAEESYLREGEERERHKMSCAEELLYKRLAPPPHDNCFLTNCTVFNFKMLLPMFKWAFAFNMQFDSQMGMKWEMKASCSVLGFHTYAGKCFLSLSLDLGEESNMVIKSATC